MIRPITLLILITIAGKSLFGQNYTEILGRPTNNTITMSILFDQKSEVYWEYGVVSGSYTKSTPTFIADKDIPVEKDFTDLVPDTKYYYRTRYRQYGGTGQFAAGAEHTFQTARKRGSTFTFAIEADPHLDTNSNPAAYTLTLQNILSKKPDFLIDLGDIFMSEKLPVINQTTITERHLLYRPYFNAVCHSVPLYLVPGNHEGELGWKIDGTQNSLPVMATNTRKLYYPNPIPGSFYTGDTIPENYIGLREAYYAWEWGDALFIVLDPFWHTLTKPGWGWSLGKDQYDWFKKTISSSNTKYKFVFCHNLVGGNGNDARGGSEYAGLFEMGGKNTDNTWGFDTYRPGWGKPIHQLMAENKTTIFFHGHDHFYGKQEKDGIVYQEVPQPSNRNISNTSATQYGYVDGLFLPGRGFLLVTVSDLNTKVEYIRTYLPNEENSSRKNGEVADTYTLSGSTNSINENSLLNPAFQLQQNFPNPFRHETSITYSLTLPGQVQLKVLDMQGKEICTLADEYQLPGSHSVVFDPGKHFLPGGIYYYQLTVGNIAKSMKMIFSNK